MLRQARIYMYVDMEKGAVTTNVYANVIKSDRQIKTKNIVANNVVLSLSLALFSFSLCLFSSHLTVFLLL